MLMYTRIMFLITLFLLTLISCERTNTGMTCGVDNPLENVPWLNNLVDEYESSTSPQELVIIRYTYKKGYVFLIDNCPRGCADNLVYVYNCENTEDYCKINY